MSVSDIKEPLACLREGRTEDAIGMLEQLARMTPGHVTVFVLLAQAYATAERWNEALSAWQRAAFLMPNGPAIQKGLEDAARNYTAAAERPAAPPAAPPPSADDALLHEERYLDDDGLLGTVTGAGDDLLALDAGDEPTDADLDTPTDAFFPEGDALLDDRSILEDDSNLEDDGFLDDDNILEDDSFLDDAPLPDSVTASEAAEPGMEVPDVPREDEAGETASEAGADRRTANGRHAEAAPLAEDQELDQLIADLESARIVPRPDYESIEAQETDVPVDDMVSETLARIYEGQKQYEEAARMYDKLAILQPERADAFAQKASELRMRADSE